MDWQEQCKEMWGKHWQAVLARTAGKHPTTVYRWVSGEHAIKQALVKKIKLTYLIWSKD